MSSGVADDGSSGRGRRMSEEAVEWTVRGYLAAIRAHEALEPFLAPNVTMAVAGGGSPIHGSAAVDRAVRHHYGEEFDARPELVRIYAESGGAATELRFVGTHIGDYAGLAPTGRIVDVPLSMFFDVEEDRITAIRIYYSFEQVLEQLRE
jgi:predicted ester cyclase